MTLDRTRVGSSLDELLAEDGTLAKASAVALKRVIAHEIRRTMEEQQEQYPILGRFPSVRLAEVYATVHRDALAQFGAEST